MNKKNEKKKRDTQIKYYLLYKQINSIFILIFISIFIFSLPFLAFLVACFPSFACCGFLSVVNPVFLSCFSPCLAWFFFSSTALLIDSLCNLLFLYSLPLTFKYKSWYFSFFQLLYTSLDIFRYLSFFCSNLPSLLFFVPFLLPCLFACYLSSSLAQCGLPTCLFLFTLSFLCFLLTFLLLASVISRILFASYQISPFLNFKSLTPYPTL